MTAIRPVRAVWPCPIVVAGAYRRNVAPQAKPAAKGVVVVDSIEVDPTEPASLVLDACASAYGRDLLAYLLGAGDGTPLEEWRQEHSAADPRTARRLRASYRILQLFKDPRRARAWLRNVNPHLDDRTPASVVRAGDRQALQLVEQQAERDTRPL
jgi:hypothetical protein